MNDKKKKVCSEKKEESVSSTVRLSGRGEGPDGVCVCPACGKSVKHERGVPCMRMMCPVCGVSMIRE